MNFRLLKDQMWLGGSRFFSDNRNMNNERQILISGIHMELTDAIKVAVHEQLEKLFDHDPSILRIRVELEMDAHAKTHKDEFAAKGHVELKQDILIVTEKGDELYICIRGLAKKLDRMLRKRSNRRLNKRNHPHAVELESDLPKAI
ncbi:MAG: ribosome-associated translation inhibitor RaiA [Verrucomicrobiota bacterium]